MNRELSERLDLLRFPLIASVVFIHSQIGTIKFSNSSTAVQTGPIATLIQATFSEILRSTAVPLFFLMSGFLFFQNFEPTLASYLRKVRNRIRTLAVPFLFWNITVLLFLFAANRLPSLSSYFTGGSWAFPKGGVFDLLDAVIGVTRRPILYPFWFLRDLIVLVLPAPAVWFFAARHPWSGLAVCTLNWLYQTSSPFPVVHHHAPLLFFYLGALMAVHGIDPLRVSEFRRVLWPLTLGIVLVSVSLKIVPVQPVLRLWFEKSSAFIYILAFWSSVGCFGRGSRQLLLLLSGLSFFVYAAHEPALIILTKLLFRFLPPSGDALLLVYYFTLPAITVVFTAVAAVVLRHHFEGLFNLITGGRGRERPEQFQVSGV